LTRLRERDSIFISIARHPQTGDVNMNTATATTTHAFATTAPPEPIYKFVAAGEDTSKSGEVADVYLTEDGIRIYLGDFFGKDSYTPDEAQELAFGLLRAVEDARSAPDHARIVRVGLRG
jgi:hypothetical protein